MVGGLGAVASEGSLSWRPDPSYGNERAVRILLECILVFSRKFNTASFFTLKLVVFRFFCTKGLFTLTKTECEANISLMFPAFGLCMYN